MIDPASCKKYSKDNKYNSLRLTLKFAQIFALGNYIPVCLKVHSFVLRTDNVHKLSEHIFVPCMEAIVWFFIILLL